MDDEIASLILLKTTARKALKRTKFTSNAEDWEELGSNPCESLEQTSEAVLLRRIGSMDS